MGPQSQFDREEEDIERAFDQGLMSRQERDRSMRELRDAYHEAADQACDEAYQRERENWY